MIRSFAQKQLKPMSDELLKLSDEALAMAHHCNDLLEMYRDAMRELVERRIKNPVQLDEQRYEYMSDPETYFNLRFGDFIFYILRVDDCYIYVKEYHGDIIKEKFDLFSEALQFFCDQVGINYELYSTVFTSEPLV